jgi:hypothetical protein
MRCASSSAATFSPGVFTPGSPRTRSRGRDPIATGIQAGSLLPGMQGGSITTREILNALAVGGVPAAVVMCGCATFQFAQAICNLGVGVAFGMTHADQLAMGAPMPSEYTASVRSTRPSRRS